MAASKPRTIADFKAAHDPNVIVPNKIRAAFAVMQKQGPEHFEYELDLARLASVGMAQMAAFRDQFAAHVVETQAQHGKAGKRAFFWDPKVAARVRKELSGG